MTITLARFQRPLPELLVTVSVSSSSPVVSIRACWQRLTVSSSLAFWHHAYRWILTVGPPVVLRPVDGSPVCPGGA